MMYIVDSRSETTKMTINYDRIEYSVHLWGAKSLEMNDAFCKKMIMKIKEKNWIGLELELIKCTCIIVGSNFLYVYSSRTSDTPVYLFKKDNCVFLSDDIEKIAMENRLIPDKQRLASLCWGANCIPYKEISTVTIDVHHLEYNNTSEEISRKRPYFAYSTSSFEKTSIIAKELIIGAVDESLKGINDSIAIALSGGLDSAVLAICMKILDKKFKCIHWYSDDFKPVDERCFVSDLTDKYGLDVEYLDIGRRIANNRGYINSEYKFKWPYNHSSFSWWLDTFEIAEQKGCEFLLSGLNGDSLFSHDFKPISFREIFCSNLLWCLEYYRNSYSIPFYKSYSKTSNINNETYASIDDRSWNRAADFITNCYIMNIDSDQESQIFFQKESLKHNIINNSSVSLVSPYLNDNLIDFSSQVPFYFKVLPVSGVIVQKPILRKAFEKELPEKIYRRTSKSNFGMLAQQFCVKNKTFICNILNNDSCLHKMNVISSYTVQKVFEEKRRIYSNAYSLIRSCFIELWLKEMEKNGRLRLGG